MSDVAPWSIARSNSALRRVLLLLVLGAVLFGAGVQAARACLPSMLSSHLHVAASSDDLPEPCHGDAGIARAVCESHCRTDAQSTRAALNFDLPAAAPADAFAPMTPIVVALLTAVDTAPPPRDNGPPLHLLFHRFLR